MFDLTCHVALQIVLLLILYMYFLEKVDEFLPSKDWN